jgi:hypothetical protein
MGPGPTLERDAKSEPDWIRDSDFIFLYWSICSSGRTLLKIKTILQTKKIQFLATIFLQPPVTLNTPP